MNVQGLGFRSCGVLFEAPCSYCRPPGAPPGVLGVALGRGPGEAQKLEKAV